MICPIPYCVDPGNHAMMARSESTGSSRSYADIKFNLLEGHQVVGLSLHAVSTRSPPEDGTAAPLLGKIDKQRQLNTDLKALFETISQVSGDFLLVTGILPKDNVDKLYANYVRTKTAQVSPSPLLQ